MRVWVERGAVAPMVALLLIPLLGMLALTVDVGYAYGQRRLAQNVADNAALNAAVVVGKRLQAPSETWVKDGDVIAAITTVASRSTGGYAFGGGLIAEYVRWDTGDVITKVGDVGTGVLCASDGTSGCIPSTATGIRVLSQVTFNTFFAPVLSRTTLSTGATAVALNEQVTGMSLQSPGVAPYALWTGENGVDGDGDLMPRSMQDGSAPPDFLCRNALGLPVVLQVNGNYFTAPEGSYRQLLTGRAYDYSCTGGTNSPIAQGTMFTVRAAPNFERPSVSVGNPNWQVGASNFKGFIRIDAPTGFVGIGSYVSDGGIAGGTEDSGMDVISDAYESNTTLVMPIVSYAVADASSGHPLLLVTGFAAVQVGPPVNSQNPADAPTSYDWKAQVVTAPVACCPISSTPNVTPGTHGLLTTRLYQ